MASFNLKIAGTDPSARQRLLVAADPATATRPTRTPTRGGIPPKTWTIVLDESDPTDEVEVDFHAGLVLGGTFAWVPSNLAAGMLGRLFSYGWAEGPLTTPPAIVIDSLKSARSFVTVNRSHVGCWRYVCRFRTPAGDIDSGALVFPFVVALAVDL